VYPRGQDQRDRRIGAGEKCARQAEVKGLSGLLKHDYLLGLILTGTFLCCKYSVPHMIREKIGTSDQHRLAPRKSCVAIQGCLCRSETRDEVVRKIMLEPAAIRRLLEPEEVAALAVYLCSDQAAGITGAAIDIDLGWTAR
jgi:enoyl-ACP reductase-like protein